MKVLLIDNHDSFTFNLYQMIAGVTGEEPVVVRNDEASWPQLSRLPIDAIVISPGPGRPERHSDFGVCLEAIAFAEVPLLGVCLGHQGIAHAFGAEIVHAPEIMHGRVGSVVHSGDPLYSGIPTRFKAVRYHSLVPRTPLPPCLEETAWTEEGLLMGLRHRTRPIWGVQFHPESICTEYGDRLIENFRSLALGLDVPGFAGQSAEAS